MKIKYKELGHKLINILTNVYKVKSRKPSSSFINLLKLFPNGSKDLKIYGFSALMFVSCSFVIGGLTIRINSKFSKHDPTVNFEARSLIKLTRNPDAVVEFFKIPQHEKDIKTSPEEQLFDILSQMSGSFSDNVHLMYLKDLALNPDNVRVKINVENTGLECDDIPPLSDDDRMLYSLKALLICSRFSDSCQSLVSCGALSMLMRVAQHYPEKLKILALSIRIIGNIAQNEALHGDIVNSGWIYLLGEFIRSTNVTISVMAGRALANLDRSLDFLYDDGIYLLYPIFQSRESDADVIFVHGLRGGPFKTWRQNCPLKDCEIASNNFSLIWPKDWLCEDFTQLRALAVEYESNLRDLSRKSQDELESGQTLLEVRGKAILHKLKKAGVGSRPIIWIGHSMGGLLIKEILCQAKQDNTGQFSGLCEATRGIIFYSVPHHGSKISQLSKQAFHLLFPSTYMQELSQDNEHLKILHKNFVEWASLKKVPCLSFIESLKTELGMKLKMFLVPYSSADPGIGELIVVNADHISVCKPTNRDSLIYVKTSAFIEKCLSL